MKTAWKRSVATAVLFLSVVLAAPVSAGPPGSAWWRFVSMNGGTAKLAFKVGATRNVSALPTDYEVPPASGIYSGLALANALAFKLCAADCVAASSTCDNVLPAPPSTATVVGATCVTSGGASYTITTNPNAPASGLRIDPTAPTTIRNAQIQWNGTFTSDLLDAFTVRLGPNGNNGVVTFDVEDASEASLGSFNVDTTGKSDLQIHTEIRNGYQGLGLGLGAIVCDQSTLATTSIDPTGFPGYGVQVTYPSTIRGFEVVSLAGQSVTQEMTGAASAATVPTMSEWGMIVLVVALLGSGLWMMRRRRRLQSA